MSAADHLNPVQFMPMDEFKRLHSGDYDEPMEHTFRNIQEDYDHGSPHPRDVRFGGPRNYIEHLKRDISKNGITEPLTVRGGNVLVEGHHRGLAAMELGLDGVPVQHSK